jgi:hypothetical protein
MVSHEIQEILKVQKARAAGVVAQNQGLSLFQVQSWTHMWL